MDEKDEGSDSSSEEEPEKSLDELINDQLDPLLELDDKLDDLIEGFDKLANKLYNLQQSGVDEINKNPFKPEEIQEFLDWRRDFEAAIKKAANLGAIKRDFLTSYKYHTEEDWKDDPFWKEIKPYYQSIGKNNLNIKELEKNIDNIQSSQKERYESYADVGKHPAAIVFTAGVLPLLILLLYGVDRAINGVRLAINEYQKSSSKEEVGKAQAALEEKGSPIKRAVHYQAAIGARPFFEPIKKAAAKETEEKPVKTPGKPQG